MWSTLSRRISFALLEAMCILLFACNPNGNEPDDDYLGGANKMLVFSTDTADWYVALFYKGLLYADACTKELPSPYRLPTKDEAKVLRTMTYPHDERFVTSDGYTFGMPSASVSKAGSKTKYSVLGLWRRSTIIEVLF